MSGPRRSPKPTVSFSAGQRLAVGTLQLQVGAQTNTLTVTTQGALIQTDTSDRGELVTTKEVSYLPMAGRNWASLLNVLPGAMTQTNSLEPDTGKRQYAHLQRRQQRLYGHLRRRS